MKIRMSYVSNSSSSSFVVSYDEDAQEILISKNGTKIVYSVKELIDTIRNKIEIHSESTYMEREGSSVIYEYAQENYDENYVKRLKEFLDKNPEQCKAEFQIEYQDKYTKRMLLNLMNMGLIDVFADKYALRDDC